MSLEQQQHVLRLQLFCVSTAVHSRVHTTPDLSPWMGLGHCTLVVSESGVVRPQRVRVLGTRAAIVHVFVFHRMLAASGGATRRRLHPLTAGLAVASVSASQVASAWVHFNLPITCTKHATPRIRHVTSWPGREIGPGEVAIASSLCSAVENRYQSVIACHSSVSSVVAQSKVMPR